MMTPGSPFVWSQAPVALMSAPALPWGWSGRSSSTWPELERAYWSPKYLSLGLTANRTMGSGRAPATSGLRFRAEMSSAADIPFGTETT
jgi:hypothetical protein